MRAPPLAAALAAGGAAAVPSTTLPLAPAHPLAADYAAARAAIDAEDWARAERRLTALAGEAPGVAEFWSLLGFARRKLGRFAEAEAAYDRALARDPDHLGALEYLGELRVEQGDLAAARALLDRLDAACGGPCEERDDLAAAIAHADAAETVSP